MVDSVDCYGRALVTTKDAGDIFINIKNNYYYDCLVETGRTTEFIRYGVMDTWIYEYMYMHACMYVCICIYIWMYICIYLFKSWS